MMNIKYLIALLISLLLLGSLASAATYDGYTQSVLYLNGTSNSTAITDEMGSIVPWGATGVANISTATKLFGSGSLFNNVAGQTGSIKTSNTSMANFGTGDYTIEMSIYPTGIRTASYGALLCEPTGSENPEFMLYDSVGSGTSARLQMFDGASHGGSTQLSFNRWWNISVVRWSGNTTLYVEGISNGSFAQAGAINFGAAYLGKDSTTTLNDFRGYIDNVRISNTARYTSNYVPTNTEWGTTGGGGTTDTNSTIYLLPSPQSLGVGTFANVTLSIKNVTAPGFKNVIANLSFNKTAVAVRNIYLNTTSVTGTTLVSSYDNTTGLVQINVSKTYLNASSVTPLVDVQFYGLDSTNGSIPLNYNSAQYLDSTGATGNFVYTVPGNLTIAAAAISINASFSANSTVGYATPYVVAFTDTSTGSPVSWTWNYGDGYTNITQNAQHVFLVANNYSVSLNATNSSGTYSNTTQTVQLRTDDSTYLQSWMQFNNATVIDLKGNAWTMSGATIAASPVQSGFGSGVLAIQTNNALISTASSPRFNFDGVNWNMGMWIYPTAYNQPGNIVARSTGTSAGWGLYNGGTASSWVFWQTQLANATPSFTLPLNTWTHVKIYRTGNFIEVYLNGVLQSRSAVSPGSFDTANPIIIGGSGGGTENTFYMDEYRDTIGTDGEVGNFTVAKTQFNGNLFVNYVNINANATLRYKTDPTAPLAYIYNQTGFRNRTVQGQNITSATNIIASVNYDGLHESIGSVFANKTNYADLVLDNFTIDTTNSLVTFSVSRSAGFSALFDNRTNLADIQVLYRNYTTDSNYSTYFSSATITDGPHGVTYPIDNFILTPIGYGMWGTPIINFAANNTAPAQFAPVQFTDSTGNYPTAWSWDFGDGGTSTQQNPEHAYTTTGLKSVTLHAYLAANTSITNTSTKTNYINVTTAPPPAPVADFTGSPTTVTVGSPVQFNDTSINSPTSWSWDFGDMSGSSSQNPAHVYAATGNYTVALTATNTQGSDTKTKTNYIMVVPVAPPVAAFTMNQTSGQSPLAIQFTDTSSNLPVSWVWTFYDDLSVQSVQNPTHTFTSAGTWNVSLKATNSAGNSTVVHTATVTTPSGFTRQDLTMTPEYTLTLTIVDSVTNQPIPVVTVLDSTGFNTTTTNGVFTRSYPYSIPVIYLSAAGYTSKSVSYVMTSDKIETTQMVATTAVTSNTNTVYTQHFIGFRVVDLYKRPIHPITVTAYFVNSSLPTGSSVDYLTKAFGINTEIATSMLNSSIAMQGVTGTDGRVGMVMFPAIQYTIQAVNSTMGAACQMTVYPTDSDYLMYCPLQSQSVVPNNTATQIGAGSYVWLTEPNNSFVTFNAQYQDPLGITTDLWFNVTCPDNQTTMFQDHPGNPGTSLYQKNFTLSNVRGDQFNAYLKYNRSA